MRSTLARAMLLPAVFHLMLIAQTCGAGVFLRARVLKPSGESFQATVTGYRHQDPWYFDSVRLKVPGQAWSEWLDLSAWKWHGKLNRQGGVAEWPSIKLTLAGGDSKSDWLIEIQLADRPEQAAVVHHFKESSESGAVAFLVPTPLREHAREFETGSQMTQRHLKWAREAMAGREVRLKQFDLCTSIWGHYDSGLARQALEALRTLGFNVVNASSGVRDEDVRKAGFRTYQTTWLYEPDPAKVEKEWRQFSDKRLKENLKTEQGQWEFRDGVAHWVLADETRAVNLSGIEPVRRDAWFREYLRGQKVEGIDGQTATFPAEMMAKATLPNEADLATRKLAYHAGKFRQWWSARQLRFISGLIQESLPGSRTETLPTDHGFFNAWGPPCIGMSYELLDLFEVGRQNAVDQLSAEDWMGLNHMYGPASTWTGAQSLEYLCAIMRSAIGERPMLIRALITPSDDKYLRLKAYSALGQGTKSFFYWTFGPTYIGTENYWSDLRSMYDGIADVSKSLAAAEDVLMAARPVRDRVAILYAVSHDYWNTDNPAGFVEKRLLWHALRHLGIQPDFLSEEDVEAGRLKHYQVVYVTDWCITRKASAELDGWIRRGGAAYLSAGAATRDEFYEPHQAEFARKAWGDAAAGRLIAEKHRYNERVDLPTIKAMTQVRVALGSKPFELPVIGCRLDASEEGRVFARFADGKPAGVVAKHGEGQIVGVGFMPMLAYGQLANFKPTTLEEKWPAEPRELAEMALDLARVQPVVSLSHPVVEGSLLEGEKGAVLVLVNYTYEPVTDLVVRVRTGRDVKTAISTHGVPVNMRRVEGGVELRLGLDWADLVILK